MRHRLWQAVPAVAAVLVLCACGRTEQDSSALATSNPVASEAATASGEETQPDIVDDMASSSGPGIGSSGLPSGGASDEVASRPAVQAAVQDLADRRSVSAQDITIVGYAEVTWPDGALGCPMPGTLYSQALVDGQQLILRVEGTEQGPASYHAGRGDRKSTRLNSSHPV